MDGIRICPTKESASTRMRKALQVVLEARPRPIPNPFVGPREKRVLLGAAEDNLPERTHPSRGNPGLGSESRIQRIRYGGKFAYPAGWRADAGISSAWTRGTLEGVDEVHSQTAPVA